MGGTTEDELEQMDNFKKFQVVCDGEVTSEKTEGFTPTVGRELLYECRDKD